MGKPKLKIILIWLGAVLGLYAIVTIIPSVGKIIKPTEIIENGEMYLSNMEDAYIVRDETVYGSPYSGKLEYMVNEGELEKSNTKILNMQKEEVKPEDTPKKGEGKYDELAKTLGDHMVVMDGFLSQRKGIVSYFVDGNEGILNLEGLNEITKKQIENLNTNPKDLKRDSAIAGEPIFKIADNSKWAIIFWTDKGDIEEYREGGRVTVKFGDGSVRATISSVKKEGENFKVVLTTNRYYKNFAKLRKTKVEVVTVQKEGLIIHKKCIIKKNNKEGVYVITALGDKKFVPIYILSEGEKEVLVKAEVYYDEKGVGVQTVKPYDEVLKNPEGK